MRRARHEAVAVTEPVVSAAPDDVEASPPVDDAPLAPPASAPAAAPSDPPARDPDPPHDAAEGVPLEPDADEGPATPRWRVVLVCVVVFALLAGAGVAVTTLLDETSTDGGDAIVDAFNAADTTNGLAVESETPWQDVAGRFGREAGRAVLVAPNDEGPRSMSVVDIGATNATIRVTAGQMTSGWGAVFRYAGRFNYWYVQAVPRFSVLNVVRVTEGVTERVGATSLVALRDGMDVTVNLEGTLVEVVVGGERVFATTSEHALGATRAGVLAEGDAGADASWDAFEARPNADNPGTREVRLVPPTTAAVDADDDEPATTVAPDAAGSDDLGSGDGFG